MSNAFLASLTEKRESKTALIQSTLDRAAEEVRDLTEVELANVEALNLEIKKLDERIEQMSDIEIRNQKAAELAAKVDAGSVPQKEVRAGGFTVTKEELTYSERGRHDFQLMRSRQHLKQMVMPLKELHAIKKRWQLSIAL